MNQQKRSKSISSAKLQIAVNQVCFLNSSIQFMKHKTQRRELFQKLMKKERVNVNNVDECECVIYILQREIRSKEQLSYLIKAFQDLKFFREKQQMLNDSLYSCLFRDLRYQQFNKYQPVFHYGERGDTFYIILKGQVLLLVPNQMDDVKLDFTTVSQDYIVGLDQFMLKINQKQNFNSSPLKNKSQTRESVQTQSPKKQNISHYDENLLNNITLKDVAKAEAFSQFFSQNFNAYNVQQNENIKTNLLEAYQVNQEEWNIQTVGLEYIDFISTCFPHLKPLKVMTAGDSFGEIALITDSLRSGTIVCLEETHLITLKKQQFQEILSRYKLGQYQQKIKLLKQFPLFKGINDVKTLISNVGILKPQIFDVIYKDGTKADYLYIIKQGEVELDCQFDLPRLDNDLDKLRHILSKQDRAHLRIAQQGTMFGFEEIQNNLLRKQRAICRSTNCELYLIPAKYVLYILGRYGNDIISSNDIITKQQVENTKMVKVLKTKKIQQQSQNKVMLRYLSPKENPQVQFQPVDSYIEENKQFKSKSLTSSQTTKFQVGNIDYYSDIFGEDFQSISRIKSVIELTKFIKLKRNILLSSKNSSPKQNKKDMFVPLFTQKYIKQQDIEKHRKTSSVHIPSIKFDKKFQISTTQFKKEKDQRQMSQQNSLLSSQLCTDQEYERKTRLLSKIFKGQTKEYISKIFSPSSQRQTNAELSVQEVRVSRIDLSTPYFMIETPRESKPIQKNQVNIHRHLFSPKVQVNRQKLANQLFPIKLA